MQSPPSAPPAAAPAELLLWRLDCGEFVINQYGAFFSDNFQYPPGPKTIVGSCYLIRHGNRYMLWDTGLTDTLIGRDFSDEAQTIRMRRSLVEQLAQIDVRPEQINRADTLASMDRFDRIARNLGARTIIQHEPADVAKLPPFPEAAR